MSEQQQHSPHPMGRLVLRYGAVWLVLMVLLGITWGTSYLKLGGYGAAVHLGIAGLQVALLWLLFMNLLGSSTLVRLCAMCGLFWLSFMFALTFSDYLTRPWNGGGTSLSKHGARIGNWPEGAYPGFRLPLDETK
jgi:cytochrome c oxidase subunit 4